MFTFRCLFFMVLLVPFQAGELTPKEMWNKLLSFENPPTGNVERERFLQSLSRDDTLKLARYASDQSANNTRFTEDWERSVAGGSAAIMCMRYYFEKEDSQDEAARALLVILSDSVESPWFRRGIANCISLCQNIEFGTNLSKFALKHVDEVETILTKIIKDDKENADLRYSAIHSLASLFEEKAHRVYWPDPNVQKEAARSKTGVKVGQMVRSGELILTEETWTALEPIEKRILANAADLGRIVTDPTEPKNVRQYALRMLQGYQRLPIKEFAQLDTAVLAAEEAMSKDPGKG